MVCLLIVGITPPPPRCDLVALVLRHQNVLFFKLQSGTDDTCSRAGGLLGTLGWSDGGSFSLPQDDIDESADQRQREGHPRQDVGVAEGVGPRHPLRTHHRVDDGAAHHEQTGKDLEGSSEEKASALLQSEELTEEEEESQAAEDDG